jgi:sulfur carrier protein
VNVIVNGEPTTLPEDATIASAIAGLDLPARGIAVAIDRVVVPRGQWDSTPLSEGARVEVVHAVQGG